MAKKTTTKRARVSDKTPKIKNAAVSRTHDKPARLMKRSKPEGPRQEVLSGNSTPAQPPAGETPVTALPDLSPKPPLMADTGETMKGPGGAAPEAEEVQELLAFRLADEEYAVDILMIKEIIRLMEVTRVPRRQAFIKGVISLRGTIIPVFDLRTRLGLAESPPDRSTRILVVGLDKGLIGVIADSVTEVIKVKSSDVDPPPAVGGGSSSGHLKGVTRMNGRLLILLDLEKTVILE
jgi:purine-binding chemotaxis protein CheW